MPSVVKNLKCQLTQSKDVAEIVKFPPRPTHLPWGGTDHLQPRDSIQTISLSRS